MESFWGTLKFEKYYLHKYETFAELSKAMDKYIYFYNYERDNKKNYTALALLSIELKPLKSFLLIPLST